MKRNKTTARAVMFAILVVYIVFLAFPLVWLVSTSFKPAVEIFTRQATIFPRRLTLENYRDALGEEQILRSVGNSFKVSTLSALATLGIAMPGAYVLARRQTSVNKLVAGWILTSQIFPTILIIVPLFLLLGRASLVNTHLGLIGVYVVWSLPFVLWMLQGYVRGVPVELEEAAAVDGANNLQIVSHIVAPLVLPGLVATGLYAFINAWNEFFFGLVLLKDPDLMTIQVHLARFRGIEGLARWGPLAAGSIIATIPSLIVFAFLQRGLVSGLLSGSVKQ